MEQIEFDKLFKQVTSELDIEMPKKIKEDVEKVLNSDKELNNADMINLAMLECNYFTRELVYRLLSEVIVSKP